MTGRELSRRVAELERALQEHAAELDAIQFVMRAVAGDAGVPRARPALTLIPGGVR